MEPQNKPNNKTKRVATQKTVRQFLKLEKELEQIHIEERFDEEIINSDFVQNYVYA